MKNFKKNKGFTLTEVIIAVAILTVAISPLVTNFVMSAKINDKAKKNLNATNMAQDIMEGISSMSAEEFIKAMESNVPLNAETVDPSDSSHTFYGFIPYTFAYSSHGDCDSSWNPVYTADFSKIDASDTDLDNRTYSESVARGICQKIKNSSNYYFFVNGIKVNNNDYNLHFTLDTSNYTDNDATVSDLVKQNSSSDMVVNFTDDEFAKAKEGFRNIKSFGVSDAFYSDDSNVKRVIKREIEAVIENNGDADNPQYVITVSSIYTLKDDDTVLALGLNKDDKVIVTQIDNSSFDQTKLPNALYINFTGSPYVGQSEIEDTFTVKNTTGSKIDVYLIRRKQAVDGGSERETPGYNTTYKAKLNVTDPNELTDIITNLKYDLTGSARDNLDEKAGVYSATRCIYSYNGTEVADSPNIYEGVRKKDNKYFIYDVKMELIDAKRNKTVATFTGGLID